MAALLFPFHPLPFAFVCVVLFHVLLSLVLSQTDMVLTALETGRLSYVLPVFFHHKVRSPKGVSASVTTDDFRFASCFLLSLLVSFMIMFLP